MSNAFAAKPELAEDFPAGVKVWTCPITGMVVPKDPAANLQWRARMLELAKDDRELQTDLYTACSKSVLFFINAFAFTLRVFEPGADGEVRQAANAHLPFVTWAIQDKHILAVTEAIDKGRELLTDKSRDMGATWNHLAVYVHRFLFRDAESHLMLSRKEDAVDQLDGTARNYPHGSIADPGTLFGKLDYMLARLPEWMLPDMSRKKMHLVNNTTKARIDGESANATAGSSDRRTSIFLDEMAKMNEGESIKRSTRDTSACRLPCSTPNGAGTAYSKWRMSGSIKVFVLAWWEHPEKGAGRYVKQDELGRWQIRSPWYDSECAKRTPKEMAIEIDMDHIGSGETFFESMVVEQHRVLYAAPPKVRLNIKFKKDVTDAEIPGVIQRRQLNRVHARPKGDAPWQVWPHLVNGRLDQTKHYVVACDISKGQGASNSTASVMCVESREKVMEYADANTPPYEFAKQVVAACLWIGGRGGRPLLIWENNGDPGFDFGNQIMRTYQYPNVWYDRAVGTMGEKVGKRYGWRSSREQKAEGLGMLRRAYAHGGFINHSDDALNEALTYIHYDDGGLGPATLIEESSEARKTHGDRVIADMLCVIAGGQWKRNPTDHEADPVNNPARCFGSRLKRYQQSRKDARKNRTFDFASGV